MKNTKIYSGYRYPSQIISHTVWLYFRFTLSFRDIEELLAARGISFSYETSSQEGSYAQRRASNSEVCYHNSPEFDKLTAPPLELSLFM